MEVHTHPHTARKKFTHYLWEFFMLFLAVTAGFFVENQREHGVEVRREVRYMRNLLQDLSRDTAAMQVHALFQQRAIKYADSLVDILNGPDRNIRSGDVYYYARTLSILNPFLYSNATVSQLKNSGSLRLIKNEYVADSIIAYDIWAQRLLAVEGNIETVIGGFRESMGNVLSAAVIKNMIDTSLLGGTTSSFITRPASPQQYITDDNKSINQLCTYTNFLLSLYQYQFKTMNVQNQRAIRLIQLLKKEYSLGD